jgi:hypothetical protein
MSYFDNDWPVRFSLGPAANLAEADKALLVAIGDWRKATQAYVDAVDRGESPIPWSRHQTDITMTAVFLDQHVNRAQRRLDWGGFRDVSRMVNIWRNGGAEPNQAEFKAAVQVADQSLRVLERSINRDYGEVDDSSGQPDGLDGIDYEDICDRLDKMCQHRCARLIRHMKTRPKATIQEVMDDCYGADYAESTIRSYVSQTNSLLRGEEFKSRLHFEIKNSEVNRIIDPA